MRKSKENPFVPIGCLGTAGALMYGVRAFKQGKTRQSQLLMKRTYLGTRLHCSRYPLRRVHHGTEERSASDFYSFFLLQNFFCNRKKLKQGVSY
ncbi:unnamed protein product [Oncorhynchus mykiss]|uniref:HIG1 domain-containing protein n=1 Tax=Oncorhynchus mykiss TaxID=8022 RepID=A0A060YNK3_ONCMY|nr:unnamed protein product [Oncorhynchus mykiss]